MSRNTNSSKADGQAIGGDAFRQASARAAQIPSRFDSQFPPISSFMFQIIGGNALAYLPGGVGVKKITTEVIEIPAGYSNGNPSTTMDGVGWARNMDNDEYVLVVNDSLSLISHDILMATPVFAVQQATIDDDATGSYTVWRITGTI